MIKPIILKEYYLSPNDVRAIAETTLTLYMSNMLRKRNMISESEHNMVLDECAHRLTPTLLAEGNSYESRKRIYTTEQYINELKRNFDEIMLNEDFLGIGKALGKVWDGAKDVAGKAWNGVKDFGSKAVDKLEDWGMYKRGDGFLRNTARIFGFNPDEGFSLNNIINGAITLGSLAAAPFTGGGSLAAGTAARMALGTGARIAGKALLQGAGKAALGAAGKAALGGAGKAALGAAGKNLAQSGGKALMKGMWSSAGRQALANRAMTNFATTAGRKAVTNAATRGIGKNLLWTHGISAGLDGLGNLMGGGQQPNAEQLQYASNAEQPQYGAEQYAQMGQDAQNSYAAYAQNPYAAYAQNPYAAYAQNPYAAYAQNPYGGGMQGMGGGNDIYGLSGYGGYGGMNPYAAYYGMA